MSEALSSSEIEDVLSSIRRLVSDELRPSARPAVAAPEAEKLLLTPALRVIHTDARPLEAPAIDDVVAAVSAGVARQADDWESETGDQQPELAEEVLPPEWVLPEDSIDEAPFVDAAADDLGNVEFLSRRAADLDAAAPEEIAAEQREVMDDIAAEKPLPGWAQADDLNEQDPDDNDVAPAAAWVGGTVEPDRAWADEAEAKVLEELSGAGPAKMDADEIVLNPSEREIPINEDVLREIVRDVLREELQGRLGERITRNIRKLVRAEIARALATEELM